MRAVPYPVGNGLSAITVVICTVLLAGVSAGAAVAGSVTRGNSGAAVPGSQLWGSRYNGPASGADAATSVAVSPGGSAVFVTGTSAGSGGSDYATVGYDAATGARRWASRYNGPGDANDEALSLAVSPDGATVFVTGTSTGATSGRDYATIAYNAATGARRWVSRYSAPANRGDVAFAVAAGPGGRSVFVSGFSAGVSSNDDYATVAYNAATGNRRWVRRYNGPGNGIDIARAVTVSPGGRSVFVTGLSTGATSGSDYATVAYSAATGARRWVSRYNGPGNGTDIAGSVAVSPDGATVFVTGFSTGGRLWASRYNGPGNKTDQATSLAVGPAGDTVYVTGDSFGGADADLDYATVAYRG